MDNHEVVGPDLRSPSARITALMAADTVSVSLKPLNKQKGKLMENHLRKRKLESGGIVPVTWCNLRDSFVFTIGQSSSTPSFPLSIVDLSFVLSRDS